MGTVEEGTMCAYCAVNEAGYIPDGCVGPTCPDCWDRTLEVLVDRRVGRWRRFRFAVQKEGSFKTVLETVGIEIGVFIVHL